MSISTLRVFFPWKYREEENAANNRSGQGYHLVKRGALRITEDCAAERCYRYSLNVPGKDGLVDALYKKQGWEQVCSRRGWTWYRKEYHEGSPESEYTFFGPGIEKTVGEKLRALIRPLDKLRNLLLVLAAVLVLLPGALTGDLTPRIACVPLFLAIPVVTYAEKLRKALGEDKRK